MLMVFMFLCLHCLDGFHHLVAGCTEGGSVVIGIFFFVGASCNTTISSLVLVILTICYFDYVYFHT